MKKSFITLAAALAVAVSAHAAEPVKANQKVHYQRPNEPSRKFQTPPSEYHPLAWYFWTGDHISTEGLTKDLEAMRQSAIGGGLVMHVYSLTPARQPVPFFQQEWREAMRHMFTEAERLDLQFGVHNCPGYSAAGGPWVPVEQSQKVLDWTETLVDGPGRLDAPLARPPAKMDFYRDVAVLAYPEQPGGGNLLQRHKDDVKITAGGQSFEVAAMLDRDARTGAKVAPSEPILVEFPEPVTVCALLVQSSGAAGKEPEIGISIPGDAGEWQRVGRVVFAQNSPPIIKTANFVPVTSRLFRLEFVEDYHGIPEILLSELGLHASPLTPDAVWKSHFTSRPYASNPTWLEENARNRGDAAEETLAMRIPTPPTAEQVIILTDKLRSDDNLDWDIPPGTWTILRFGMTTTADGPHPAPPGSGGLEVDKLDGKAMRAHMENYIGKLAEDAGPLTGSRFRFSEIDSHEKGFQNWTYDLPEEFSQRRGYPIGPWMVAMAGRPLNSLAETDRFLWDFRRAVLDLWANEYWGVFAAFLRENGMLSCAEAYGHSVFDSSQSWGRLDAPMAEAWWNEPDDDKPYHMSGGGGYNGAASAANTYGRTLVPCEAFSTNPHEAGWRNHPRAMKRMADGLFLGGINQIIFHAYPLQTYDTAPGLTLSVWGSQFGRLNSWWPLSRAWHEYLGRCQYLLRQGRSVSDFARHLGEEAPESFWLPGGAPAGFRVDDINTEVIVESLLVRDGKLVLPHGATYEALVIETRVMRPELARKLAELVEAGATVIAPKPLRSPGFKNWREADAEVRRIADAVWGACDGKAVKENRFGKGRVIWGKYLDQLAAESGLKPDFESPSRLLGWFHRTSDDGDFYFVVNGSEPFSGECLFRVDHRQPELWDPVSGAMMRPRKFEHTEDGRTRVTLDLPKDGSVFVVFPRKGQAELPAALDPSNLEDIMEIAGPWNVSFEPNRGAPASAVFDKLQCWTENPDPGIKYFSGVAKYTGSFDLPPNAVGKDARMFLDLGTVADLARVRINGHDAGSAWATPHRVEVTGLLRDGGNELEIEVANRWINRLIGDEQYPDDVEFNRDGSFGSKGYALARLPEWFPDLEARPEKRRVGFPFFKHYTKDSPLVPSGLIGPVRIQTCPPSQPRKTP